MFLYNNLGPRFACAPTDCEVIFKIASSSIVNFGRPLFLMKFVSTIYAAAAAATHLKLAKEKRSEKEIALLHHLLYIELCLLWASTKLRMHIDETSL